MIGDIHELVARHGYRVLGDPNHMGWLLDCNVKCLRSYMDDVTDGVQSDVEDHVCPTCEVSFPSILALRMHRQAAHQYRNGTTQCVLTNQCPICRAVCKTKEVACNHLRNAITRRRCPKAGAREKRTYMNENQLLELTGVKCPVCAEYVTNHDRIQEHMTQHILANVGDDVAQTLKVCRPPPWAASTP